MSIVAEIAHQRKKLLDGIEANEGDINLRIFEDFYPDEAHFIYELLQNAEDAGATEVSFELSAHSCAFEHDGTRHFNERDIRGITGIFNSSKTDNPDKIGKFGVGFKSVFVYTNTPVIYSKDFSFKILELVLPQEVPPRRELGSRTRFEFPFNNPKKSVTAAHTEVESGLQKLSETTLLFLKNLRLIRWKVGNKEGAVQRKEHSNGHIEVLKFVDGKEVVTSHWLRFAEPVQDLGRFIAPMEATERQKVAVAFELQLLGDTKSFDKRTPLSKQMKIVPAVKGSVSVYFPADKETSGLRFHLHGPFVPELSRASIKNSPENLPLYEQLAALTAKSLHAIRDYGMLTGEFLAVLPNNDDNLPSRYTVIRKAVLDEMRQHPLVPTHGGGHAPAARLIQSRAVVKALLRAEDLALVTGRDDEPDWVIGATQRNSKQDRMLSSLDIPYWDEDDLKLFFEEHLCEPDENWDSCQLSRDALQWIAAKSFDWLQELYSVLYKHCEPSNDYGDLRDVYFVRLSSGEICTGSASYFSSGQPLEDDPHFRVDERVLTSGSKQALKDDARRFLERLGVREPNELDEMVLLLHTSYGEAGAKPTDKEYIGHLKKMISFSEKFPHESGLFASACVIRCDSEQRVWAKAQDVYLDDPYLRTDLWLLYESDAANVHRRWPLSDWYRDSEIPREKLTKFAEWIGCQTKFDGLYEESCCSRNPSWGYLLQAPGRKSGNGFNRDFALSAQGRTLIRAQRVEASLLVWDALCQSETVRSPILKACYQRTERGGPLFSDSQLVHSLRELPWIPQTDGEFVKPSAALASRLPSGFRYDAGYKWVIALGFGSDENKRATENAERAAKRNELGFESEEDLEHALAFMKIPPHERQRIIESAKQDVEPIDLPVRPVRNADLRQKRVGEAAKNTPAKESVARERIVQLGVTEAKSAAKLYLADQYTNPQGKMVCQVCKDELPFKLPNGAYYFEAVEVLVDMTKRYREGFLALCPNHAAAFRYANAQRSQMQDLVETASGNEIEVVLGGELTTIYFTQMHLADAQACLATQER